MKTPGAHPTVRLKELVQKISHEPSATKKITDRIASKYLHIGQKSAKEGPLLVHGLKLLNSIWFISSIICNAAAYAIPCWKSMSRLSDTDPVQNQCEFHVRMHLNISVNMSSIKFSFRNGRLGFRPSSNQFGWFESIRPGLENPIRDQ